MLSVLRGLARRHLPKSAKRWVSQVSLNYAPLPRIVAPADPGPSPPSPYPSWAAVPNPLTELAEKYRPTKRYHNYLVYYWLHFRDIREHARVVVEIGVESDRSVRMWREFFPNATIYGLDINPACKSYESDRIRIFIGDQSDPKFLDACLREIGSAPDVVIDDGSHLPAHQIATFNHLFPKLSDHGVYVVEDTGGCVQDTRLRTVERLKALVNGVYYWPPGVPGLHWTTLNRFPATADWYAKNVTGVAFYRWIAFVMRGHNPADNPYLPLTDDVIARDHLAAG